MSRKTTYNVNFSCTQQEVNAIVQSYLEQNGFTYEEKDGMAYYKAGNAMINGFRFFEYYINGNQLTVNAYLKSPKKPFPLDNGIVGALNTAPYAASIKALFEIIENQQPQGQYGQQPQYGQQLVQQPVQQQYVQGQYTQQPVQQQYNPQMQSATSQIGKTVNRQNSISAVIAFIMGIINVILACGGMTFGIIIIVIGYILAISGIKSDKKTLALSAIALLTVSLGIIIFKMIKA